MTSQRLAIEHVPPGSIREHPDNPRRHSPKQRRQIARSIRLYGFLNPILVNQAGVIIAGHGRYQAAADLGLDTVPVIRVMGISEAQHRALMIADNKLAEGSSWDEDRLTKLLRSLVARRPARM